jgi:hypothetical protein
MNTTERFTRNIQTFTQRLAFVLLFGMALTASAGDLNLLINGKAWHLDSQPGVTYNENNWGAGLHYDLDATSGGWRPFVNASGFKDSNENPSYYAGGGVMYRLWETDKLDNFAIDAGGLVFLMKREGFEDGHWFPGILPALTIGSEHLAVNITYIPKVDPKMVPILFFQLKVRLVGF